MKTAERVPLLEAALLRALQRGFLLIDHNSRAARSSHCDKNNARIQMVKQQASCCVGPCYAITTQFLRRVARGMQAASKRQGLSLMGLGRRGDLRGDFTFWPHSLLNLACRNPVPTFSPPLLFDNSSLRWLEINT